MALKSKQEIPFDMRSETNVEEKRSIAVKAARFVEPGDTLFLDISSTAMYFAREISHIKDITVVTNSVIIALEFIDKKDVTLISTGGTLRPNSYSLVGPLATGAVKNYRADKFFCSCRGFSLEHGVSDSNELENEVKRAMFQQSSKLYLLMDHSKYGETGLARFAAAEDIDILFTDDGMPAGQLQELRNAGLTVL
jgi:DeoR/GlpR family transcriptional regulator of sugar metabolism